MSCRPNQEAEPSITPGPCRGAPEVRLIGKRPSPRKSAAMVPPSDSAPADRLTGV
jgi:hypothetical protein